VTAVQREVRRRVRILLLPGTVWISLLYVVPALLILAYSFLTPRIGGGVEWKPSLEAYKELLEPNARASYYNGYLTVLLRSVVLAAATTVICLGLALPLAVFISRRKSAIAKNALLVAVMIPFWTSLLVRTYAMRYLLANTGPLNEFLENLGYERQVLLNTRLAVLLGLVYTALPFMILPLYASVERVDMRLLEAGRDLGASARKVFVTVFVPLIRAGITVGCVMVFVISVSQFLVPTLLGGGKVNMVANLLEQEFGEAFNWPLGAAIALFFSALTLLSLWLIVGRREQEEFL
jgi:spermidine/putrescine transport system permease protein